MQRGKLFVAVIGAFLFAAAIATAVPPAKGPDPAVRQFPRWPYLTRCGDLAFNPVQAFSGQANAEEGTLPSEVKLRQLLDAGSIPYASRGSWRKIAEDSSVAEFTRGRLSGGYLEWVRLRNEDGQWRYSGNSSDCAPTSIVGNGPVVTWTLDSGLTADDVVRRIRVHLGPGPCSSGKPQNPRARPVFRRYGKKLLLTIWLKPLPPGAYTCQGIAEPPKRITLPRRMRIGELLDGGTYPPTLTLIEKP